VVERDQLRIELGKLGATFRVKQDVVDEQIAEVGGGERRGGRGRGGGEGPAEDRAAACPPPPFSLTHTHTLSIPLSLYLSILLSLYLSILLSFPPSLALATHSLSLTQVDKLNVIINSTEKAMRGAS
jgi:hypothetical protein